jgi:filamentous hemagglutinin family protein
MNFANLGANLGLRTARKSTADQRRAGRNAAGTTLRIGTALASGLVVVLSVPAAHAQAIPSGQSLPTGGVASAGATISTQATAVGVDLHNTSQLISWNTFDVATGNTVSFSSTDGAGATFTAPVSVVNRVVGTGNGGVPFSSAIYGTIDAANSGNNNIAVWLINPSGITFGPGGGFSGGSLVLSTLDFGSDTDAKAFSEGTQAGVQLAGTGATLALSGSGAINATGDVALFGENVSIGKSITAAGNVNAALAQTVRFTAGVGSPLTFTLPVGTSVTGAALNVTGGATISGSNVKLVAASPTAMTNALLSTDSGTTLSATAVDGDVTLLLISDSLGATNSIATGGALSANRDVMVSATGNAGVFGAVAAGQQYTVEGGSVTLGQLNTAVNQTSVGATTITAKTDDITGLGALKLQTNLGKPAATNALSLITTGGQINFGLDTTLDAGSGAVQIRQPNNTSIALGSVSANDFSTIFGTTIGVDGDFIAKNLLIFSGLRLEVGGNIRLGSASTLAGGATMFLQAGKSVTGLATATASDGSDTGFGRVVLTGSSDRLGAITVNAGELAQLGTITGASLTVTAGQATTGGKIDLASATASDGPISLTTYRTTGTGNQDGQILVGSATSQNTATVAAASSVRIGNLTALNGNLNVTAGGDLTGLAGGTPDPLALGFGSANLSASPGSIIPGAISATAGGKVQLGTLVSATDTSVSGTAIALTSATATNGALSLTASNGPIVLGTATSGGDATISASGATGNITLTSLTANKTTASAGTSVIASQNVRAGSIAATNGNLAVTAQNGDLTGLLAGTPDPLGLGYGSTDLTSGVGSVSASATGKAQLGAVSSNTDTTVSGTAVALTSATAGGALSLTASSGMLMLGTGTAGGTATLTKSGATGELVVGTLTGNGAGATLTSTTSVRLGSLTARNGAASVTATMGDVTGLAGAAPGAGASLGGFGSANVEGSFGSATVTAANGVAQLGAVFAGPNTGDATVTAQSISATSVSSARDASLTATAGALSIGSATVGRDLSLSAVGALSLGIGTAARDATVTVTGASGTITITSLTGNQTSTSLGTAVTASKSLRAGSIASTTGNLSATAQGGDLTGLGTGSPDPLGLGFGSANLRADQGSVTASAAGAAQLGTVNSATDTTVSGTSVAVTGASANGNLTLTATNGALIAGSAGAGFDMTLSATNGALTLGTGSAGRDATLTKSGTGGDLSVASLNSGTATTTNGTAVTSSTSVRAGSITAARGPLSVTAMAGDVTGLSSGTPDPLGLGFGSANLAATLGPVTTTASGSRSWAWSARAPIRRSMRPRCRWPMLPQPAR